MLRHSHCQHIIPMYVCLIWSQIFDPHAVDLKESVVGHLLTDKIGLVNLQRDRPVQERSTKDVHVDGKNTVLFHFNLLHIPTTKQYGTNRPTKNTFAETINACRRSHCMVVISEV